MEKEEILKILVEKIKEELGIDKNFLIEVNLSYPSPQNYCCLCNPLHSGYRGVYGSNIKISCYHNLSTATLHLLHEMYHANDLYKKKLSKFKEFKAELFALKKFPKYFLQAIELETS